MKIGFKILMILCAALTVVSCDKTKSYTDMLKAEEKAIDRLIASENIEVLKDYPRDSVFKDNQYILLENGVYMNVIDSGNGKRATLYKTQVMTRFTANYFAESDSVVFSNYGPNSNGTNPVEFKYGLYQATTDGNYTSQLQMIMESMVSEGLECPLQYVGDRAKVRLIVPFKKGSIDDQKGGRPVFYKIIEYKFL
ncbi:MAG: DUF4827 domain-containing protein [Tannerellaceae bacterium]